MADFNTIARPYAQAVFALAREKGTLKEWSETLELLATVARDPQMGPLLVNHRLTSEQLQGMILDVCGDQLDQAGRNFVALLGENWRLVLLPEIAEQYEALRAAEEGTLQAKLISAKPVEKSVREALASALGKRLSRKVTLQAEVDESLLGGAVIRAGDLVIDDSVRGRLKRLAANLNR